MKRSDNSVRVRLATDDDILWVNARYNKAGFLQANLRKEIVAIAEISGKKAAVGRLSPIDDQCVELGSLYVEEIYRGRGVAKHVVDFLLGRAEAKRVYALPFKHLSPFYNSIGFQPCEVEQAPKEVRDKFEWCRKRYEYEVTLLMRDPSAAEQPQRAAGGSTR